MLAVLAIGVEGGGVVVVAVVSAFLCTHTRPLLRGAGGGLAHSYALAQNRNYVKLFSKSFNINDLRAMSMHHNLCSLRKPQHVVCLIL